MTILLVIGLPGAGKSTWLKAWRESRPDAAVFDDYYDAPADWPRSEAFEHALPHAALEAALRQGRDVVIADIVLCIPTRLEATEQGLARLLRRLAIDAPIERRFFANDPRACLANIVRRDRPGLVAQELALLSQLAAGYRIPEGAEVLAVGGQG